MKRACFIVVLGAANALVVHALASAAPTSNLRAVPPDQLGHYWVMTNTTLEAEVPNIGKNLDKPTCAAVTYTIGNDGRTRDIVLRRVVPAGDLGSVAVSAVANLGYAATASNDADEPVFTYIIMPFNLPSDPAARARITAACRLADFPKGYR